MNIKFYKRESKIYDFLNFPNAYEIKTTIDSSLLEERSLNKTSMNYNEDYLKNINYLSKKLEDHMEFLEKFYLRKIINNFNLVDLIIISHPILGYENIEEYFYSLMSLESEVFVFNIIKSINHFWAEDRLEPKCKDLYSYLNNYDIDDSSKWLLLNIGLNSKEFLLEWKKFLDNFRDDFEKIYGSMEARIESTAIDLQQKILDSNKNFIEDLTGGLVREEIFDNGINILISIIYPYQLSITSIIGRSNRPYISWGVFMEESLRYMKEEEENKLNTRVEVFKALGDRTRYELLLGLLEGNKSNKEIAKDLGVSAATISYHINSFVNSKIIEIKKKDSKYTYDINKELIKRVILELKEDLRL